MTEQIALRDIQHFLYCPHRWGLMKIDCAWAENYFVAKADAMHERVHDPKRNYTLRGRKVFTSLRVYCDLPEYDVTGVADCLEATPCADGVTLDATGKRYGLCIVEYKPTMPKGRDFNADDAMQVYAQKVCVDHIFGCDCDAVLYYADKNKRVMLPFREGRAQWDARLRATLAEMRRYLAENCIPPIPRGQNCGGCSLKDMCMPKLKTSATVRARIALALEDDA
jgi:CRISPR-associated exonuclease Cas4